MSRYLFILGAGASKECGAPLMGDFLERAGDLYRDLSGGFTSDFRIVSKAIAVLQQVHSKAELDLYNLESVFGALEMARMLGGMPGYSDTDEIKKLITALRRVIAHTLEQSIRFPCDGSPFRSPDPYRQFAKAVAEINRKERGSVCSIITFNYDNLIEVALYLNSFLGYNDHVSITDGKVPVLKLHGSLNWGSCPNCKSLHSLPISSVHGIDFRYFPDTTGTIELPISVLLEKANLRCCGRAIDPTPVIVPPSWNKTEYAESVGQIWREAAKQLSDAENIFICGYSLPETDVFFKHLFALGAVGQSLIRRFWVIDPDSDGTVEKRFRNMLGKAALSRFKLYQEPFSAVYSILHRGLDLPDLATGTTA